MSKINPLYERGDVKYFREQHKERQRQMGTKAVNYSAFYERLKSGMTLKDAIYTPSMNNHKPKLIMKPKKPSLRFRFISLFK